MQDNKDIGSFFEKKLGEGKKSPDKNLWAKINNSLDEIELKKRKTLPYWLMGIGVFTFIGLFMFLFLSEDDKNHSEKPGNNTSSENSYSTFEKTTNSNYFKVAITDSLETTINSEEVHIETITDKENPTSEVAPNSMEIVSEAKIKRSSAKSFGVDDTFTITEKYLYYNSEDGKQWTTTDKMRIDSLLNERKSFSDSSLNIIKDSLGD